ncbi:MAG TPA: polysaccharide biosynthesis/export family protein [Ramlibacter sp.]|nr:polysaccharide biosynthesis/export family protein [Ramlibacter sp.]
MIRQALAAAALLMWTACFAQQPTTLGNAASSAPAASGTFRPATSEPSAAGQQPVAVGLGKEYRVGTNDLLDVEVLNLENGKRTVRVNAAGFITLPLIGPVAVAGLTQQQVEAHVASLYGEKYLQNPQVSVFIKEFTTERITIDGAVSKPGIYPLVGQMTLLRALALAGGFGQIANSTEVKVFRHGDQGQRQVATFDVDRIRAGKDEDPAIRGDDLIVVQRDQTRALLKDSVFRDIVDSINPFSIFSR